MYRTESLVQYFPRLSFLNFIFNFILSCFFLYLKVYANEADVNNNVTKDSPIYSCFRNKEQYQSRKELWKPCIFCRVETYNARNKIILIN